jgi:putative integral membrane protein (TIGR02587 family)
METWYIGETMAPPRAVAMLGVAYLLNLVFVTWVGFRRQESRGLQRLEDALEATAVAVIASTVTLVLLNLIHGGLPLNVIVGRIAINAVPISFGIAIANHILASGASRLGPDGGHPSASDDDVPAPNGFRATLLDFGAAFAGALFLSFNIAPTQEIPMLATIVPVLHLPAIIAFSLLLSYAIVFVAGFGGEEERTRSPGPFQRPVTETFVAYLASLVTSASMLWLFGAIGPGSGTNWLVTYAEIILLGLPASVGAAAGRLAV